MQVVTGVSRAKSMAIEDQNKLVRQVLAAQLFPGKLRLTHCQSRSWAKVVPRMREAQVFTWHGMLILPGTRSSLTV